MNLIKRPMSAVVAVIVTSVLMAGFPVADAGAEQPSRGNFVPADVGTQVHPFIEAMKFQSHYGSGTLTESLGDGWRVRTHGIEGKETMVIPNTHVNVPSDGLERGVRVLLKWDDNPSEDNVLVVGYDRRVQYLLLILASLGLCAIVGGWITVRSMSGVIVGLLYFYFVSLPAIQGGSSVLLHVGLFYLLVTLLVLPASLGWNRKAISAVLTALTTGIISVAILEVSAQWINVTGLRNETMQLIEYSMRYFPDQVAMLDLRSMVVGATLIGSLGVILDVSVDVTSSAAEITRARPDLPFSEILSRTITVSSRLVGTMTNTLLLAYVGTDIFLILTIYVLPTPTWITLNEDFVAVEVLRGLGGALGFLAAVPLAVAFYSLIFAPDGDSTPRPPTTSKDA